MISKLTAVAGYLKRRKIDVKMKLHTQSKSESGFHGARLELLSSIKRVMSAEEYGEFKLILNHISACHKSCESAEDLGRQFHEK